MKIDTLFSQRLKKKDSNTNFQKLLSMLNTLSINIPLVEALMKMSGYAKFMKELVTKKRNLECEIIDVSHHCSGIVTNNLVAKKDDPGDFTIPCTIRVCKCGKALCDLEASVNLMALAIFEEDTNSTMIMRLLMDDQSIKRSIGILHYVLLKEYKFILLTDFVIINYKVDIDVSIILGRPFFTIERGISSCRERRLDVLSE